MLLAEAAEPQGFIRKVAIVLEMIKFQHTIFALPFALAGMLVAARGLPTWWALFWILCACVFARTAAMSFNRWADAELDARNPRTAMRAIPAKELSPSFVLLATLAASALFIVSAGMLNRLALVLSPVALLVLLGYSYCKRFTPLSHLVLGLALGIAPVGAWVAVRGMIELPPILLAAAVMFWTAGFDIIYACQDVEVDRQEGLYSIPSILGYQKALVLARAFHGLSLSMLLLFAFAAGMHWPFLVGMSLVAGLLLAQHLLVKPNDLRRINIAFFTINSWVGMVVLGSVLADFALFSPS